jgi:hypothetical protein
MSRELCPHVEANDAEANDVEAKLPKHLVNIVFEYMGIPMYFACKVHSVETREMRFAKYMGIPMCFVCKVHRVETREWCFSKQCSNTLCLGMQQITMINFKPRDAVSVFANTREMRELDEAVAVFTNLCDMLKPCEETKFPRWFTTGLRTVLEKFPYYHTLETISFLLEVFPGIDYYYVQQSVEDSTNNETLVDDLLHAVKKLRR